jgi:hypothetical protein
VGAQLYPAGFGRAMRRYPRVLLQVGFELGRAAVLDAVPERELEGDLVIGGQFGDRRRR